MYTPEKLIEYPYFEKVSEAYELKDMLDPLTGLLRRPYIIEYANCLIRNKMPFVFGMLDLDNFKHINDTYGHSGGDTVLREVARGMMEALEDFGVCGRFGGDEYFFIDMKHTTYDSIKSFLNYIYLEKKVIRRYIDLPGGSPLITATVGCVSYPTDANNYSDLFGLMDKCLYRGKTKGRNCYIIYVADKHRNIDVKDLAGKGLLNQFYNVSNGFDVKGDLLTKLSSVFDKLAGTFGISDLYYVGDSGRLMSIGNKKSLGDVSDIGNLVDSTGLFTSNSVEESVEKAPKLKKVFDELEIETSIVFRVESTESMYGYLLCAEPRNRRIWQDEESALLYFLTKLLAGYLDRTGERLA